MNRMLRKWRRTAICRRKYGDRCPHIEKHARRPRR